MTVYDQYMYVYGKPATTVAAATSSSNRALQQQQEDVGNNIANDNGNGNVNSIDWEYVWEICFQQDFVHAQQSSIDTSYLDSTKATFITNIVVVVIAWLGCIILYKQATNIINPNKKKHQINHAKESNNEKIDHKNKHKTNDDKIETSSDEVEEEEEEEYHYAGGEGGYGYDNAASSNTASGWKLNIAGNVNDYYNNNTVDHRGNARRSIRDVATSTLLAVRDGGGAGGDSISNDYGGEGFNGRIRRGDAAASSDSFDSKECEVGGDNNDDSWYFSCDTNDSSSKNTTTENKNNNNTGTTFKPSPTNLTTSTSSSNVNDDYYYQTNKRDFNIFGRRMDSEDGYDKPPSSASNNNSSIFDGVDEGGDDEGVDDEGVECTFPDKTTKKVTFTTLYSLPKENKKETKPKKNYTTLIDEKDFAVESSSLAEAEPKTSPKVSSPKQVFKTNFEYYATMRRKSICWYLFWLGCNHLLQILRNHPNVLDHDDTTTRVGLDSITINEWMIRSMYVTNILSLIGLFIGLLSNRIFGCINEHDEEDIDDCRHFHINESNRLARKQRHGSCCIFITLVCLVVSVLCLIMTIEHSTWLHAMVMVVSYVAITVCSFFTACCIATHHFLDKLDELNDHSDDEDDLVFRRRNRQTTSYPKASKVNSKTTSLSITSSAMFGATLLVFLAAFILRTLLAPVCRFVDSVGDDDGIGGVAEETVSEFEEEVEDVSYCLETCPLTSNFNYHGASNVMEAVGVLGIILVTVLLLPQEKEWK